MSALEAWIYCKPAAWNSLEPGSIKESWHYPYRNAVTGFWKSYTGGFEVYNVIGSEVSIQDLIDEIAPADIAHIFSWVQGTGNDDLDVWPTDPTEILAVMQDHPGPVAPTLENPNWGHVFLGQKTRIFSGSFNSDFNGDFK